MKTRKNWPMILLAAAALGGAVTAVAAPRPEVVTEAATVASEERSCCVANPRFAGICKVSLGPEETCQDVLDYLNNAQSKGRTYCGNTDIRMGWAEVECQEESATARGACRP